MDSLKKFAEVLNKVIEGKKDYYGYIVNKEKAAFICNSKFLAVPTLITFSQIGNTKNILGFLDGTSLYKLNAENAEDAENVEDLSFEIVVDSNKKNDMQIFVKKQGKPFEYSSKASYNTVNHSLLIFQENKTFNELILFDTRTNLVPTKVAFSDEAGRLCLRNFALSYLATLGYTFNNNCCSKN